MVVEHEHNAQQTGGDAYGQVEPQGGCCAYAYHDGHFPCLFIRIAVAEVVDQQQRIDGRAAGYRSDDDFGRQRVKLNVIGGANGHDAEKQQDQYVAQPHVGEVGGVEEAKDDAEGADGHHLKSSIEDEWQADGAGRAGGDGDGPLHGVDGHPSLRAGSFGSQARLTVVGTLHIVEEVVDEVGIDLHDEGEEQA